MSSLFLYGGRDITECERCVYCNYIYMFIFKQVCRNINGGEESDKIRYEDPNRSRVWSHGSLHNCGPGFMGRPNMRN